MFQRPVVMGSRFRGNENKENDEPLLRWKTKGIFE